MTVLIILLTAAVAGLAGAVFGYRRGFSDGNLNGRAQVYFKDEAMSSKVEAISSKVVDKS